MKVQDVLQCSFNSWYGTFSSLTIESAILPLSSDVLEYLAADGILVDGGHIDEMEATGHMNEAAGASSKQDVLNANFKRQVNTAIMELGGEVFPKLNWSSPKDAAWITPNHSLKCTNADEVFLLLKSSDFVIHDLTEPFLECEDTGFELPSVQYVLVLRKWMDLHKCNEFRCFVSDGELIAISQRHSDSYFPALAEDGIHKQQLVKTLQAFFSNDIRPRFRSNSYAFDVYVDGDRALLLDFNPWGIVTDSLLFTWNELNIMMPKTAEAAIATSRKPLPELRVITDAAVRPVDPFSGLHGVPLEYHRLAMDLGEGGKQPVEALLELMQNQTLSDDEEMDK